MTRTSSVSRRLGGDNIEIDVSARHVLGESRHDHLRALPGTDGPVSFRIKPDRRSIDIAMPAGRDRRRC